MKDMFFKFFERFIVGGYSVKVTNSFYLKSPKLFFVFLIAFITTAIGQLNEINTVKYIGYFLIIFGVFSFFYYDIFPSRRPKI